MLILLTNAFNLVICRVKYIMGIPDVFFEGRHIDLSHLWPVFTPLSVHPRWGGNALLTDELWRGREHGKSFFPPSFSVGAGCSCVYYTECSSAVQYEAAHCCPHLTFSNISLLSKEGNIWSPTANAYVLSVKINS